MHTIRLATAADADAVSRLLQESYFALLANHYPPQTMDVALPVMARAQPALLGSGRFFVAETDVAIVACGGWSDHAPGSAIGAPRLGHLRHFATHPLHLRRGLARRIGEACAMQARTSGKVSWQVLASLGSVPFYTAIGLDVVGHNEVPIGGIPVSVVLMEGPIPESTRHENARPGRA